MASGVSFIPASDSTWSPYNVRCLQTAGTGPAFVVSSGGSLDQKTWNRAAVLGRFTNRQNTAQPPFTCGGLHSLYARGNNVVLIKNHTQQSVYSLVTGCILGLG